MREKAWKNKHVTDECNVRMEGGGEMMKGQSDTGETVTEDNEKLNNKKRVPCVRETHEEFAFQQ